VNYFSFFKDFIDSEEANRVKGSIVDSRVTYSYVMSDDDVLELLIRILNSVYK
jgi:hypothetical protein